MDQLGWRDALVVGFAQVVALMPGVSRSGVTMSADPRSGSRFSFLLATPVTLGAGLYKLLKTVREGGLAAEGPLFAAGIATSAVVGWLVIRSFLAFVQRQALTPFVCTGCSSDLACSRSWPRGSVPPESPVGRTPPDRVPVCVAVRRRTV